jgi:2-haloacid dehalogenase
LIDWRKGIETRFIEYFAGKEYDLESRRDIFERYVSLEAQEESDQSTFKSYGRVLEETSIKLAKSMGLTPSLASAKKFAETITKWPAFPDTAPSLKKLGNLGKHRTILSNIDTELLKGTIRNNDLQIDDFITAQEVKSYKPNKEHWLEFFRRTGARKDEVLHVAGSIYHDIVPAKELGLSNVWVNRYGEKESEGAEPDRIISDLSELVNLL